VKAHLLLVHFAYFGYKLGGSQAPRTK